ncbi:MAG TPA: hypothetical protein VFY24_16645 [Azospira sp.]|nr:hypothetical protein [Azospira sp.]
MTSRASTAGKRILVLGDYRQTVVIVRSLARAGYEVTLATGNPLSSTALSSCVSEVWVCEQHGSEQFNRQLECYLRAHQPDFVFVVGESQLRSLVPEAARFAPLAVWVMPAPTTAGRCLDKSAMYALTRQLGIPTLDWSEFAAVDRWRQQAAGFGYPVVVKHRDSSAYVRGRKALILNTPESLDSFLAGCLREPKYDSLLLQKFAYGRRHNCHFGAAAGRLVAYFEQAVLRTDELDGTGIGIEGISVPPSPQLRAYCAQLLAALAYNGVGCIQFLVDEARGTAVFLELNPRLDSTVVLPYRLRYDLPRLAVELARDGAGHAPSLLNVPYRAGVRYHWLYGDLLAWQQAWRQRQRSPGQLLAWAARSLLAAFGSYHLTWDLRDPLPTLHMYWSKLVHAVTRRLSPHDALKARIL